MEREWLVLLDHEGHGPLGDRKHGDEGELEWKIVAASCAPQAIRRAFGSGVYGGYEDPHMAVAVPIGFLPEPTVFTLRKRTEHEFEVLSAPSPEANDRLRASKETPCD